MDNSGKHRYIDGTIVMEGFLWLPQWVIRLVTRLFARTEEIVVAFVRFAEKQRSWFITNILISGVTILNLALIYFTSKIAHGRVHQHKMNTFLGYAVAVILFDLKLQVNFWFIFKTEQASSGSFLYRFLNFKGLCIFQRIGWIISERELKYIQKFAS